MALRCVAEMVAPMTNAQRNAIELSLALTILLVCVWLGWYGRGVQDRIDRAGMVCIEISR